ncbi:hypothetical protein, partial [Specibacter sp. RAF43]|uniref:hypothetical protein n=1 Tax=Specibacter sp. RAF43 TaxID=3233057 RepID=UPI003F9B72AA
MQNRRIQPLHNIQQEPGQVISRQPIPDIRGQKERRLTINTAIISGHAPFLNTTHNKTGTATPKKQQA